MKTLKASLFVFCLFLAMASLVSAGDDADQGDIVINEFMADPSQVGDTDGEWIELVNVTGSTINIDGWTMADGAAHTHTIDNGGTLNVAPGDYLVLCTNEQSSQNGGVNCDYEYPSSVSLNNSGDTITFQDDGGETIAERSYPGSQVTSGASTFYVPSDQPPTGGYYSDQQDDDQWAETDTSSGPTYGDGDYGTPGAQNTQPGSPDTPATVTYTELGVRGPIRWTGFPIVGLLVGGLIIFRRRG